MAKFKVQAYNKYKKVAALYDKIAIDYSSKNQNKVPAELEKFSGYFHKKARILDVGCAAGRDTKVLYDKGFNVVGVDFSTELLKIARNKYPDLSFIKADIRKLSFSDESFDGIYANAVFHHLLKRDMIPVLRDFNRILRPGGIIYLSTKTGSGTHTGFDVLSSEKRWFTLIDQNELNRMLCLGGFKKIKLYIRKSSSNRIDWNVAFYKKV